MSWPIVKPPWNNVKWLTWPQPSWVSGPNPQWSEKKADTAKTELDILKEQIEVLDKKGEWEFLKRSSNPYELVFSQTQDIRIPQSICSLKPLSRSFFKMVEILTVMDFFKRNLGKRKILKSAHVCEGPGGFIEALLYLSSKNTFTVENAWAMTLRPTKTNIPGWKRAYHFLKKSPMVSIEYGADDTGDIMIPVNQGAFLEKTRGKCQIFTADGGFDFSEHYGTQEEEVLPLLISSVFIGLQTLIKGGDFILKIFDTESRATIELLALLASCFEHWTLYKPGLSRPCNAEKYFLGRGYKIAPGWIFKTLVEIRNAYACGFKHMTSIFTEIPKDISIEINNLIRFFMNEQISALQYAISHKDEWNLNPGKQWSKIQENSIHWCRQFQIPTRNINLGSALVNKANPIPWNQVVASHRHLEGVVQLE
uniref:Ribosomal RNA methyltransferase FtsJ domain-containing protein n=1 Tax=viral metagenome TaxID=1070528 RepID=A0A6C0API8_9ZZZZ